MQQVQKITDIMSKVLKKKKIDKYLTLKITQNTMSGRIFVEFSSEDGKLTLQRSFQDTDDGHKDSARFQRSIRSINGLKKYFGVER